MPVSSQAQHRSTCAEHAFTNPAASVMQTVTVPPGYDGSLFRPADTAKYPGKRPAIALMHGRGGDKCGLHGAARLLAAHGYVTLTYTVPGTGSAPDPVTPSIMATKRAIKYLRASSNPFDAYVQDKNIGLAGHSLGAIVVSYLQGASPPVKAIVALDNLRKYLAGDPGSPLSCVADPSGQGTPRVPALGLAMDFPCLDDHPKTDKQYGWKWWRAHKKPALELVMKGFAHNDFANGAADAKLQKAGYYTVAWFDRWLGNDASQCGKLLSKTPLGIPITLMLSGKQILDGSPSKAFHSAGYLPGIVDTGDLLPYLQTHPPVC